jgi:hypothetical protein
VINKPAHRKDEATQPSGREPARGSDPTTPPGRDRGHLDLPREVRSKGNLWPESGVVSDTREPTPC